MQADREKLWRAFLTFAIQDVEGIAHIVEKIIASREAAILIEAIVVCLIGIWDNEMGLVINLQPVGQFVRKRIAVVQKPSCLDNKPTRVRARSPCHPTDRSRASKFFQNIDC